MRVSREVGFHAYHSHRGMLTEPKHDHEFKVVIAMEGEPNEEGFVVDYRAVKRTFNRLVARELEGRDLDELFEYPTSENLAKWVWEKLTPFFPLYSVEVREKPHSRALYYGPPVPWNSNSCSLSRGDSTRRVCCADAGVLPVRQGGAVKPAGRSTREMSRNYCSRGLGSHGSKTQDSDRARE